MNRQAWLFIGAAGWLAACSGSSTAALTTLRGQVVDPNGGGVAAVLLLHQGPINPNVYIAGDSNYTLCIATGSDGAYSVSVPHRAYAAWVFAPGYALANLQPQDGAADRIALQPTADTGPQLSDLVWTPVPIPPGSGVTVTVQADITDPMTRVVLLFNPDETWIHAMQPSADGGTWTSQFTASQNVGETTVWALAASPSGVPAAINAVWDIRL